MKGHERPWKVKKCHEMSWKVYSYHQSDISSEKIYGWVSLADGLVDYSASPSPSLFPMNFGLGFKTQSFESLIHKIKGKMQLNKGN